MISPIDRHRTETFRLDRLVNPQAPIDAVGEALADTTSHARGCDPLHALRRRIAAMPHGSALGRTGGRDRRALRGAGRPAPGGGTVRRLPADAPRRLQRVVDRGGEVVVSPRAEGFSLGLARAIARCRRHDERGDVAERPDRDAGGLVDLVRLARRSGIVVVDERHGAYTPRTTAPVAREFENVVVLQSMDGGAGSSRRRWRGDLPAGDRGAVGGRGRSGTPGRRGWWRPTRSSTTGRGCGGCCTRRRWRRGALPPAAEAEHGVPAVPVVGELPAGAVRAGRAGFFVPRLEERGSRSCA